MYHQVRVDLSHWLHAVQVYQETKTLIIIVSIQNNSLITLIVYKCYNYIYTPNLVGCDLMDVNLITIIFYPLTDSSMKHF